MKPAFANTTISGKADVETVHVLTGQFVTVWLSGVQVELRVRPDGVPEIFCDSLKTKPFSEWELAE
jgi:hypothetical protein